MNCRFKVLLLLCLVMAVNVLTLLPARAEESSADKNCPFAVSPIETALANVWKFDIPPGTTEFWASVGIRNPGEGRAVVYAEVYDAKNMLLMTISPFVIDAGGVHLITTSNIKGQIPAQADKLKVISDQPINTYEVIGWLKDNWSTMLSGIPVDENFPAIEVLPQVTSCCGYSASGNPYPCCGKLGNCTWWCWRQIHKYWGRSPKSWGNAKSWASNARANGYPVSSTPKANRVGVRTWGTYGHVAWVTGVSGSYVQVTEMNWCYTCKRSKTYPIRYFNAGYIKNK